MCTWSTRVENTDVFRQAGIVALRWIVFLLLFDCELKYYCVNVKWCVQLFSHPGRSILFGWMEILQGCNVGNVYRVQNKFVLPGEIRNWYLGEKMNCCLENNRIKLATWTTPEKFGKNSRKGKMSREEILAVVTAL